MFESSPPTSAVPHPTPAALAILNSLTYPDFEGVASAPLPYPSTGLRLSSRASRWSQFTTTKLLSLSVFFVVIVIQFLLRSPTPIIPTSWDSQSRGSNIRLPPVCRNAKVFEDPLPISRAFKMSLLEEAKRVAAEFDYPAEKVNQGVKEFIKQMG